MNNMPRGPLDQQPDEPGWWVASDGKWYPPELAAPTEAIPVAPWEQTAVMPAVAASGVPASHKSPLDRVRSWPLWAKIAVPVVIVLLIAGIAGAGKGPSSKPAAIPLATMTTKRSTTTQATTTTAAPTTTQRATTTHPPTTPATTQPPTTQPATTQPATTQPPATQPPTTQSSAPADPGDSKNCSDFATYADAKAWFDTYYPSYGDVARLDADSDGIPCESLSGAP